jgi:vancomycin resistance protein VanW
MSPLTVTERHGHKVKSFPDPDKSSIEGIDATISGGWLDLKVKNETDKVYQIEISFDDKYMYGSILTDKESDVDYEIENEDLKYIKENEKIYECVSIVRKEIDKKTKQILKKDKLYEEKVLIEYELPEEIEVKEV